MADANRMFPFSWERLLSMGGDTTSGVPLLPFEQSLLITLLEDFKNRPHIYLSDIEDIDIEEFQNKVESLINRMSRNDYV